MRYITMGVKVEIPLEMQLLLWQMFDQTPAPKDYLQIFSLSIDGSYQIVHHYSEQPKFDETVRFKTSTPKNNKIYIISENDYITMLLANEY